MLASRILTSLAVGTAACADAPADHLEPDAGVELDGASADAPIACTADRRLYVVTQLGPELEVASYADVETDRIVLGQVGCGANATAIATLTDGSVFVALQGGSVARVSANACTPMTITPALGGDLALVGVGSQLLALARTTGVVSRIDPATGSATPLATIPGVSAKTSLAGGARGAMIYIPAGLGGSGQLIPLDEGGQPTPKRVITGASSSQGSATWVSLVRHPDRLWLAATGYFGAGGAHLTRWHPITGDQASPSPIETYASTVAVTAATCPEM